MAALLAITNYHQNGKILHISDENFVIKDYFYINDNNITDKEIKAEFEDIFDEDINHYSNLVSEIDYL